MHPGLILAPLKLGYCKISYLVTRLLGYAWLLFPRFLATWLRLLNNHLPG